MSSIPELTVTKCVFHNNFENDIKVDKLSSALEMRLRHSGCSKQHNLKPEYSEATLGKILRLRESPNASLQYVNSDYSVTDESISLKNIMSNNLYVYNDYMSAPQDEYDMEEIRQAREKLIAKRREALEDPKKKNKHDFIHIRNILRKYNKMEKELTDIYDDDI